MVMVSISKITTNCGVYCLVLVFPRFCHKCRPIQRARERGDNYFVPTGKTHLHVGDRLMLLSDNQAELECALAALGITLNNEQYPGILTFFHPIENNLSSIFRTFAPEFGERVGSRIIG